MYVLFPIVGAGWEVVFNHLKQWLKQHRKAQDELCSKQVDEAARSLDFLFGNPGGLWIFFFFHF